MKNIYDPQLFHAPHSIENDSPLILANAGFEFE